MKEPRPYVTIGCNDRFVIAAAATRRALTEAVTGAMNVPISPDVPYTRRTFAALVAYAHAVEARYTRHLPRKVRDRIEAFAVAGDVDEGALHSFVVSVLKGGQLDHVGSARLGVAVAGLAMFITLARLPEDSDVIELDTAVQRLCALLPISENLLSSAVARYLSDQAPALAERAVSVFNHDLTAPVLTIAPDAIAPLVGADALIRQIPSTVGRIPVESFPLIAGEAVDVVLGLPPSAGASVDE